MAARRSWAGRVPALYRLTTAPFEPGLLGRWRRRVWEKVPKQGLGLEVGAGAGANFAYYPLESRVIAVDTSHEMLRVARCQERPVPLVVADVEALPFRDGTFDWAVGTLVFCEVAHPVAGFDEVNRVLRPEGEMVLLEHVRPKGWLGKLADWATAITGRLLGEHFNRRPELSVQEAGFEVERREWLWRDVVTLLVARPRRRV